MLVAFYHGHRDLPFWTRPSQPWGIFDPEIMKEWFFDRSALGEEKIFFKDSLIYNIIMGLHLLEAPKLMGNVSLSVAKRKEDVHDIKRIWVQISTLPSDYQNKSIPKVVDDKGEVRVFHLWGGDNGTSNPFGFLSTEEILAIRSSTDVSVKNNFWTEFFMKKLREARLSTIEHSKKVIKDAEDAEDAISVYSLIPR